MYENTWEARTSSGSLHASAVVSVIVSVALHAAGLACISAGLLRVPAVRDENLHHRYAVRQLELHSPEPKQHPRDERNEAEPAASSEQAAAAAGLTRGSGTDKQTIAQPGFRTHEALPLEAPIPSVVIWTPELATVKNIVPPAPAPPSAVQTPPSTEAPNLELQVASEPIATGRLTPLIDMQSPGTTSPVTAHTDSAVHLAPATTSRTTEQPTPAAVLSVSDLRLREGQIVLPPVNQQRGSADSAKPGSNAAALSAGLAVAATLKPASPEAERNALAQKLDAVRIQLPKEGRFGFVALGSIDGEDFPEAFEMWKGRVAYTAYLHVGLPKSWILQYAQTRAIDARAAGVVAHLDAPWPYDILRPNLKSQEMAADALIIHGLLTEAGRFESLALAFPAHFPGSDLLLEALRAWQFRPARMQGTPVTVEVLLIIPEQSN